MMKSFFKKLAFMMAMAMVVSLAAPAAQTASAAETQEFTYAYQNGGKVTKLYMDAEETLDLKFVGVKNYAEKKSDLEMNWVSYPKSVATVDKNGVVTAVADGNAIVYLEITDKTGEVVYTSKAVNVVVGEELAPVKVGTAKDDLADLNTVYELEIGGPAVDLAFFGVPNFNKANYTVTWVAYEDVLAEELVEATAVQVDKNGVVAALAEGKATVMPLIVNNVTGELLTTEWVNFVVVPAPTEEPTPSVPAEEPTPSAPAEEPTPSVPAEEPTPSVPAEEPTPAVLAIEDVKQKSHNTFDVNFTQAVSYGRQNVYLYRIFDTDKGDVYAVWAVEAAKLSEDGKTLTVQPYVDFNDGERYLVAFENIEKQLDDGTSLDGILHYEFTVKIGEVDTVEITWNSTVDGTVCKDCAYASDEDSEEEVEVVLGYKLFCDEVDLTEIYKNEGYVEFTLENEEQVGDFVELADNVLVFTKASVLAKVKATYTYENKEGEEDTATGTADIISEELEPFSIAYVEEWSITNDVNWKDWSWSNPDHDIRAGKTRNIALLLVDSRGGKWETIAKDDKIPEFGADDTNTEEMYLEFYSTDYDHFSVSTEENIGTVQTYTQLKNAVIYVALHDEALLADRDSDFVRNIGACVLEIQAPAEFSDVVVRSENDKNDVNTVTLVTDAVIDPSNTAKFVEEFTTETVLIKAIDQDKANYNPKADPAKTGTTVEFALSTTNKDLKEDLANNGSVAGLEIDENADGTATIDIDSVELSSLTDSSKITITVTATWKDEDGKKLDSAKTSFKINLKDPEFYDADEKIPGVWASIDEDVDGDKLVDVVKPTSWNLTVDDVGLMPANGASAAKIKLPMLSKSYEVGYYNRYDMSEYGKAGDNIYVVESEEAYSFKKGTETATSAGIYVIVIGPENKVVKSTSDNGLGVYMDDYAIGVNVTADNNGDNKVDYMPVGEYTVKVTFVDSVKLDADGKVEEIEYKTRTDKFKVSNDIDLVKFVDMKEVETERTLTAIDDLKKVEGTEFDTLKKIIGENYKFTFDKNNKNEEKEWNPDTETTYGEIMEVDGFVRGGYVTIKTITFKMNAGNGKYYTVTTVVNRAVKLGVDK